MPHTTRKTVKMPSDFLRDQLVASWMLETQASVRLIALVRAANSTSKKKTKPTIWPAKPMSENTCGKVTNMSEGPALAATASAEPSAMKAPGTIMMPARKLTMKSKLTIRAALVGRLSFLST